MIKKLLLYIFTIFLTTAVYSQTGTLSGTITDPKGETVIGAAVSVTGTTIGVATDFDGKYSIKNLKPGKYSIQIAALGFKKESRSVEVSADKTTILDIKLQDDALLLQEAVVVGYGLEQKRDVTGSIATIKAKDINNTVQSSFDQALQGRASGLQITGGSGVAGAQTKVQIRGTNSVTAGSSPLYVIDGIIIDNKDNTAGNVGYGNNPMSDINPNDIENIEVLKDAAACAIYGSRGANGVILITTKKGKDGKTKFDFSYSYGTLEPTKRLEFLNAKEQLDLRDKAQLVLDTNKRDKANTIIGNWNNKNFTRAMADSFANATGGIGSEWIDGVLQTGQQHNYTLSATGGNERTTFYVSGAYRDETSFLKGSHFKRLNTKIALDNKATDKLTIGTSISINNTVQDRVPIGDNGGLGSAQQNLPFIPIYNSDSTFNTRAGYGNPLWQLENWKNNANIWRTIANIYGDLHITKALSFRSQLGVDNLSQTEYEYQFRDVSDTSSRSYAWERRANGLTLTNSNYFTFRKNISDKHDFNFLLGNEITKAATSYIGVGGTGFTNDYLKDPQNGIEKFSYANKTASGFLSYYSRLNYKFLNRYLLGASIRYDGSSRFAANNKFGSFPSVSAGWLVSDEAFLKDNTVISFLKLRTSWGQTGNAEIGDYASYGFYSVNNNGYGGSGGLNNGLALTPSQLANPNLRWEKANAYDLNLDMAFFKNRIALSATVYRRVSTDLLMTRYIQTSAGFGGILTNIGKMENKGLEITINTKNIDNGKFTWSTDFNISFNRNKVLDAAGLPADAFESGEPGEGRVLLGYPVGQAYVVRYAGVQKEDGQITVRNADGTAKQDANGIEQKIDVKAGTDLYYDKFGNLMTWESPTGNFYDNRVPRGNPTPQFFGGISNTFTYKGFDLNFLFSFVVGNTIYDDPAKQQIGNWSNYAQRKDILDAYSATNTSSNIPALITFNSKGQAQGYNAINSDRYLYDASFIRLRSLTFGYNLSEKVCKKIKVSNLRIYLNGGNLLTFTKYPGWDPEVLRNVNTNSQQGNISFAGPSFQTPQARTIQIGVKIGF
jgi:TonB-linked SusC/RagA family outer membrane protein